MTTDSTLPKTVSDPPATTDEPAKGGRWLESMRQRLRLGGRQTLRQTITAALETGKVEGAAFSAEEREMLRRLLHFEQLRVDDVMVPRADIIAIDESEPLSELMRMFRDAGVSRIPLYHETLDDPRGMVHIKDLLRWLMGEAEVAPAPAGDDPGADPAPPVEPPRLDFSRIDPAKSIAAAKLRHPILYVPPSMPAMNLLVRMQSTRNHMALVVDEYGGTDGLVTFEDLVEQIVGDIADEHDEAEADNMIEDPKLGLVASARTPLEEVEAALGVQLAGVEAAEDIDTLGGLVVSLAGRVPVRGELVRHASGIEFEILDADQRRIKRVRIHVAGARAAASMDGGKPEAKPRPDGPVT